MKFEGVTFIEEACAKMTRKEFIERHINVFWQDRDRRTRRKMLGDVYKMIVADAPDDEEQEAEE